ncbi:hypothetical protein [Halorubrum sp. AS12]
MKSGIVLSHVQVCKELADRRPGSNTVDVVDVEPLVFSSIEDCVGQ